MWFFRLRQAPAETLQCISQTLPLAASSFAIVRKFWRHSADHAPGSVTGSGSFLTCRSRCQAFYHIFCDDPRTGRFRIMLTGRKKRLLVLDSIANGPELEELHELIQTQVVAWAGPCRVEKVKPL